MQIDMEYQIHVLEQEAYAAILRAFKAQSDALSWEKEGLITELRKELRVSDDEHRELLTTVNADTLIHQIREWRKAGGSLGIPPGISQSVQDLQSPTISASRKRQKTFHSGPFSSQGQMLLPQSVVGTALPSPLPLSTKRAPTLATFSRRSQHYPHSKQGPAFTDGHADRTADPLIGRKVMRRCPSDNNFYEAIITNYNAVEGRHTLTYNIDTENQSEELADLKEIPPEDIRWIGDDPVFAQRDAALARREQVSSRDHLDNDFRPSQNGVRISLDIEILHTDTLLQKVEKVVEASHPNLHEIEKAKKMLKEHEQALIDAIEKIAEACDDGSDGYNQYPHGLVNNVSEMGGRITNSYDHGTLPNAEDDVVVI